jgi:hypothetical protein
MKAEILKNFAMARLSQFIAVGMLLASIGNLALAQDAPNVTPTLAQVREAMKSQFPAPPPGFAWKLYNNVIFLAPEKWNEREKTDYVAGIPFATYATSPEEFAGKKQFEMGLTIEFISGSERVTKIEVKKLPLALIKPILDSHKKEEILILEQGSRGDFDTTYFRYRDAPAGLTPIIIHKFFLANKTTDIVNVITFESPEGTWEQNWKIFGTPIIGQLKVLPNPPSK